ncbi:IS3 family transposase [Streptomyces sp. H27-D2]|uniref:IS3 family transposase n=1 Tax=Streptomyces sp. H27-D2 TaxID=3046304 RepID=UPI003FA74305
MVPEEAVPGSACYIHDEKAERKHPVTRLCRVLGVSRATYYAWVAARPASTERAGSEGELVAEIRRIHASSRGAYGAPRVTATLRRAADQPEAGRAADARTRYPGHYPAQAPQPHEGRRQGGPLCGPHRPRLHRRQARHQARRRYHVPADSGGLVVSRDGHRPGHA